MSKVDAAKSMRHSFVAGTKCVFAISYNARVFETHFVISHKSNRRDFHAGKRNRTFCESVERRRC